MDEFPGGFDPCLFLVVGMGWWVVLGPEILPHRVHPCLVCAGSSAPPYRNCAAFQSLDIGRIVPFSLGRSRWGNLRPEYPGGSLRCQSFRSELSFPIRACL